MILYELIASKQTVTFSLLGVGCHLRVKQSCLIRLCERLCEQHTVKCRPVKPYPPNIDNVWQMSGSTDCIGVSVQTAYVNQSRHPMSIFTIPVHCTGNVPTLSVAVAHRASTAGNCSMLCVHGILNEWGAGGNGFMYRGQSETFETVKSYYIWKYGKHVRLVHPAILAGDKFFFCQLLCLYRNTT